MPLVRNGESFGQTSSRDEVPTIVPIDIRFPFGHTRRVVLKNFCAFVGLSFFSGLSIAQGQGQAVQNDNGGIISRNPIDYATARFSRVATSVRTDEEIVIDGVLEEASWETVTPAKDFIQFEPSPGMPATEPTEVYFLYDDDNLYVAAICFQADPLSIVATELQKDFGTPDNDGIAFMLDTLHDLRSGFVFATNPAGARSDSQTANDGGIINRNWDGVWDVQVKVHENRWIAEFMVPFKTLRFTKDGSQEWGLNVRRRVRGKNEDSHWAPIPRPYNATRASMAGTLRGLENIRQGRNLKIKPFAIAGFRQVREGGELPIDDEYDGGLDLKYGLSPSVTLDVTYRTDFAQVEADQQQVNLTRFSLFFPEKREFFIENSSIFGFGESVLGRRGGGVNVIPFFSRRIGLSGSTPVPIVGGARMSGQIGNYDVGLLSMKTESVDGRPSDTFTVGRIKRKLMDSSWIGGIFTNRDSTVSGDYNRLLGVDARFRLFQRLELSSYVLKSTTPGVSGDDQARQFEAAWLDSDFTIAASYHETQQNFNPEVGFTRRRNIEKTSGNVSWRPRLESNERIRNLTFSAGIDYYANNDGEIETREQTLGTGIAFYGRSAINLSATRTFDRLSRDFAIRSDITIPTGDYNYDRFSIGYNSNRSRKISGNVRYEFGEFWDGRRESASLGVALKPNPHLNFDLDYSRNQVRLSNGSFKTNLVGARLLYSFTTRMFLNAFLQYNTDARQFSSNVRFHIIHHPLSDLYVVFNERRDTQTGQVMDRALVLKFTQLFSF